MVIFYSKSNQLSNQILISKLLGAWLGHDGFQWPGSGDFFHLLHHRHFDCNYGWPGGHLDWLFGTFVANKEEVSKIWGRRD